MNAGDHFHTAAAIAADCNILHKGAQLYLIDAPRNGKEITASTAPVIMDPSTDDLMSHMNVGELIRQYNENKVAVSDSTLSPLTKTSGDNDVEKSNKNLKTGFQIVVTGAGFACIQNSCPELLESVCRAASVFARMKPSDKKKVVQTLMASGSHVLFCGDGANDMEALSTATVGVSLVSILMFHFL
jgi:magnesium-transporting ATPase (P-type)